MLVQNLRIFLEVQIKFEILKKKSEYLEEWKHDAFLRRFRECKMPYCGYLVRPSLTHT